MKNYLKKAREESHMTQREAAGLLGVSQNAFHQWETGKRKIPFKKLFIFSLQCERDPREVMELENDDLVEYGLDMD